MSNFNFLKKDLEWKIVKTQCRGPTAHNNPQPTNGTLSSFKKEHYILLHPDIVREAHFIPISLFVRPCPSLFYTRSREKISLSWESRNEWQIEIWVVTILAPLHRTHRFFDTPYFLSWTTTQERKLHTPLYPRSWELKKWVTNWDMSGKSF